MLALGADRRRARRRRRVLVVALVAAVVGVLLPLVPFMLLACWSGRS